MFSGAASLLSSLSAADNEQNKAKNEAETCRDGHSYIDGVPHDAECRFRSPWEHLGKRGLSIVGIVRDVLKKGLHTFFFNALDELG